MTNRYNTPEQGTLDWHNPLNENFNRLDREVEIRDTDASRVNYDPKTGSKFLAVDTGAVYLGDGSQWNQIGSLSSSSDGGAEEAKLTADNTLVAPPGSLQSTIDSATTSGSYGASPLRKVRLQSGMTYEVNEPLKVKPNVELDCNGAQFVPTRDVDVLHVYENTKVVDPFVNTRPADSWGSRAIVVGPSDADKIAAPNRAWVENAYLFGRKGTGTGSGLVFYGGGKPVTMNHASGQINGFENAVYFHADGSDTSGRGNWVNGNRFDGMIQHPVYAFRLKSHGAEVSGNEARAQIQPHPDVTRWAVHIDDNPRGGEDAPNGNYIRRGNSFWTYAWDWNKVSNRFYDSSHRRAAAYYVGTGHASQNKFFDLKGRFSNDFLVNRSHVRPKENGVITSHGWKVRGATDSFQSEPEFDRTSRNYHSSSSV